MVSKKACPPPDCRHCQLRRGSFFESLSDAEWDRVIAARTRREYNRDNILFYDGNPALGLFLLCKGRVKIIRSEHGYRQQIVRIAKAPDLVGVRSLVAGEPYLGSGVILEDSVACFLPAAAFWRIIGNSSAACRALARRLAQYLGAAEDALSEMALHPVRERLARYLIEQWERRCKGEQLVALDLSRHEIAESLGTSIEVISRALADFRARGWLFIKGQQMRVLNEPRLRGVARLPHP